MDKYLELLTPILIDAFITLATFVAVLGLIISVWLILFPHSFATLEEMVSRSISLRRSLRPLEISRYIDRHIYRRHKLFGLLVITAGCLTIYRLMFDVLPAIPEYTGPLIEEWLLNSLNILLLLGNLVALIIGLVVYIRPSELKELEAKLNRWVSLRQQTRWLDKSFDFPDKLSRSHPRLFGLIIFILCIYFISLITTT